MRKIFTIIAIALFTTLGSVTAFAEEYPAVATVVKLDTAKDLVTVKDSEGFLWGFYGVEDWCLNDTCAMIMNDCGTDNIFDDEVVKVRYCGNFKKSY